jgi:hypothetical protein
MNVLGVSEYQTIMATLKIVARKMLAILKISLSRTWLNLIPINGKLIECIFFYGASNVLKADRILQVVHPRTTVLHGDDHFVSLFFKDLSKLPQVKDQILWHRFMYLVFGSGSMHLPYALLHKQTQQFNNGHDIGLIRAVDMIMAG